MTLAEYLSTNGVVLMKNGWDAKVGRCTREFAKPTTVFGYFDFAENLQNVVGKRVWICDFRNGKNVVGKPIRAIEPMLVEVLDAESSKKTIYYSPVFFKQVKKDGTLKSAEISSFDNTGFRTSTGECVNIFESKEECVACYKAQLKKALKEREGAIKLFQDECDSIRKKLNKQ